MSENIEAAWEECIRAAIADGALKPQGLAENMAAGVMAHNGQSFANTAVARGRLEAAARALMRKKGFDV